MAPGIERSRPPARALAFGGLATLAAAAAVGTAGAATSRPVVLTDPSADVAGPLDITRFSLRRASDGRLRGVVTFAAMVTPETLLARSGPPGSACIRVWTDSDADPAATPPRRLVCVTARSDDELRGGVYEGSGSGLPERVADASISVTASGRSVVIRFTQSSLGRPQRIRFAVEATRPGCARSSCVDTVPDGRSVRSFRLR